MAPMGSRGDVPAPWGNQLVSGMPLVQSGGLLAVIWTGHWLLAARCGTESWLCALCCCLCHNKPHPSLCFVTALLFTKCQFNKQPITTNNARTASTAVQCTDRFVSQPSTLA